MKWVTKKVVLEAKEDYKFLKQYGGHLDVIVASPKREEDDDEDEDVDPFDASHVLCRLCRVVGGSIDVEVKVNFHSSTKRSIDQLIATTVVVASI